MKHHLQRFLLTLAVLIVLSPALLFCFWMLSLSLKQEVDNAAIPPIFIPSVLAWENYGAVLCSNRFILSFHNSLIITGTATILALLIGTPAGWALARLNARLLIFVILLARMTPGLTFLIPYFLLFQGSGLLNTLWPQIILHLVITVPTVIWVMIGFFETIPPTLEQAARIDGATDWQIFFHIALPLARPGLVIAGLLSVIFSWNNLVFGLVLSSRETRSLPVAIYGLMASDHSSWGPLAAAALLVTAPVLILTILAQKQIATGIASGVVKL